MTLKCKPLITIITVVYNGQKNLEKTIQSVITQTYSNIEYIIIDGGSLDGTIEIIKKFTNNISFWVSEPDKGIYDAMNKGIERSKGEWINFMNSGDTFYDENVVSSLFDNYISNDVSVLYGQTLINYFFGKYIVNPLPLNMINSVIPFCHQSSFIRTQTIKINKFDINYKISADYNLFLKLYKNNIQFAYFDQCISVYDATEGLSSQNEILLYKEHSTINCNLNSSRSRHIGKLYVFLKNKTARIIPDRILSALYKYYFKNNPRYKRFND